MTKKHKTKHFLTFGVYIFILFFAGNLIAAYFMHFYVLGASCMTTAQVTSDSRCLYIMQGKVYQKATRDAPHQGHPCGIDVTAIIPADHLNNPAAYLLPNYVANICAAATPTPVPTATPKPTATPTPKPTATPTLTPTKATVPTTTPTVKPTPTPTDAAMMQPTVTPTPTDAAMMQPTVTPTPTDAAMMQPTVTPTLTLSPINPSLNIAVSLVGMDSKTVPPLHVDKPLTVFVYNSAGSSSAQLVATVQGNVSFDAPSATFVNPTFSLTNVPPGQYQLFAQASGFIKTQMFSGRNAIFSLANGVATPIATTKLLGGDVDRNNVVDIADYNGLLRCYGLHISNPSPSCANPQSADLNDDGVVDSADYNIFLYNLYAYRQQNNLLISPTPIPTMTTAPTPTKAPIATATPVISPKNTPKPMETVAPTMTMPTVIPKQNSIIAGISSHAGGLTKIFDILVFLLVCGTVILGIIKSSLFSKKKKPGAPKAPTVIPPTTDTKGSGVIK